MILSAFNPRHRTKLFVAFVANLIALPIIFHLNPFNLWATGPECKCCYYAKDKSKLKQIANSVYYYMNENNNDAFPADPTVFKFNNIVSDLDTSSWHALNETSPYYFFPAKGTAFSGNVETPLAVMKKPLEDAPEEIKWIVFQDGHVESINSQKASELIFKAEILKLMGLSSALVAVH